MILFLLPGGDGMVEPKDINTTANTLQAIVSSTVIIGSDPEVQTVQSVRELSGTPAEGERLVESLKPDVRVESSGC